MKFFLYETEMGLKKGTLRAQKIIFDVNVIVSFLCINATEWLQLALSISVRMAINK